jgi:flagellar biosynthesis component FlhA
MTAEQPTPAPAKITFDIDLARPLVERLAADNLPAGITQDLQNLLQTLGIPATPQVKLIPIDQADTSQAQVLALSVDDQPLPFPSKLLTGIYHYIATEMDEEELLSASLLPALGGLSAAQLGDFVRLACTEILKHAPATLLTFKAAAAYRARLGSLWGAADLPDADWLQKVLSPVLKLRIALTDLTTVVQVLQEDLAASQSQAQVSEKLIAALRPQVVEIQLPRDDLKQLTLNIPEKDRDSFSMVRDGLFYELGIRFPEFALVAVEDLEPHCFRFKINHLTTRPLRGLQMHECLVNDTPNRLRLLCIEGQTAVNPANLSVCATIPAEDAQLAEQGGLTTWDAFGYLVLALSAALRQSAPCFLDSAQIEANLDKLGLAYPKLVETARASLSPEKMVKVLRGLLSEEVSIRNLRQILEAMLNLDYDDSPITFFDRQFEVSRRPEQAWFEDPDNLQSLVRKSMCQYLSHKYKQRENTLVVYLLDPEIEEILSNDQMMPAQSYLSQIKRADKDRILSAIRKEVGSLPPTAKYPLLLTTFGVRPILRQLVAPIFPKLAVLSYDELAPDMNIEPVARINLN